jgi:hypothetical protein
VRVARWLGLTLGILALLGCDRIRPDAPVPPLAKSAGSTETEPLRDRVAYELHRVRQRLAPPPGTPELVRQKCPDPTVRERTPDQSGRVLVLRELDQRTESRHLLPLRIAEQLRTHELDHLGRYFEAGAGSASFETHLGSGRDRDRVLGELGRLGERRYLGVYHVTEYAGPELVLHVGEIRRKWEPGTLQAWFVVYDLDTKERLCAVDLKVRSDTRDAPISARLRSETRQNLEVELGRQLVQQARERLAGITSELRWPASSRNDAD